MGQYFTLKTSLNQNESFVSPHWTPWWKCVSQICCFNE